MKDLTTAGPAGLNLLGAAAASAQLEAGEITSEALVADCLERIAARDPELHAWAFVDADLALAQARVRDGESRRGPLHGIPVGVKDIIDTGDMPTEYGSSIYRGFRPDRDQACVAALREAGAVILGKTATTEFASPVPIGVVNPRDAGRSPGVSSSGSAAAVADYMTPLALGTQTGGSVILPAAFCGVWGYKASLDGLDRAGFRHLRPTLDTLGLMARSAADLALLRVAMIGAAPTSWTPPAGRPIRIGVCRTPDWSQAQPETVDAIETAARRLAEAGAEIGEVELPPPFADIEGPFRVISGIEGLRSLEWERREHGETMNHWLQSTAEAARDLGEADYEAAKAAAGRCRAQLADILAAWDALLTPSTQGEATTDLTGVSNSCFNRMWTLMHGPTVTIPAYTGPNGAPVGVQIVGPVGDDDRILGLAGWIGERIG